VDGGLLARHTLPRPVNCYERQADYPRLVERLQELSSKRLSTSEIADKLNDDGFRPPARGAKFTAATVLRLMRRLKLGRKKRHGSQAGLAKHEYRPAKLAQRLGLSRDTLKRWIRAGWVNARKDEEGHSILWADAGELRRRRELAALLLL
jgi:hypothetical protein